MRRRQHVKVYVLDGAGTHGRSEHSIVGDAVDRLVDSLQQYAPGTTAEWVPREAALLGVGVNQQSWADNSRDGVGMLVERMTSHQGRAIIIAYSAGNKPAHDFLDAHPEFHDRIAAVGLVSDPWRPASRWQHGTPQPIGYGIMGEDLGPLRGRTFWTSVHDDVISAAWPDALLRYVADVAEASLDDVIERAIHLGAMGEFQLAWQTGIILREPLTWFFG